MELWYLGFNRAKIPRLSIRLTAKGEATRQFVVTVDLELFRPSCQDQEGPTLCGNKLLMDLETQCQGLHELTTEDLRNYGSARECGAP